MENIKEIYLDAIVALCTEVFTNRPVVVEYDGNTFAAAKNLRLYRNYVSGVLEGMKAMADRLYKNAPKSSIPEVIKTMAFEMIMKEYGDLVESWTNVDYSRITNLDYIDKTIAMLDSVNLETIMNPDYPHGEIVLDPLREYLPKGVINSFALRSLSTEEEQVMCNYLLSVESWTNNYMDTEAGIDKGILVIYISSMRELLYTKYRMIYANYCPRRLVDDMLAGKKYKDHEIDQITRAYVLGYINGLLDHHFSNFTFKDLEAKKKLFAIFLHYVFYYDPVAKSQIMDGIERKDAEIKAQEIRERFTIIK